MIHNTITAQNNKTRQQDQGTIIKMGQLIKVGHGL